MAISLQIVSLYIKTLPLAILTIQVVTNVNITLYKTTDDIKTVNKTLTDGLTLNADITGGCDIISPVLKIATKNNITSYNYCYIPAWNRYYYINNITASQQRLIVECSVDVLMSWRNEIDNMDVIVERSENVYNLYLPDEKFKLYNYPLIQTRKFTPTTTTQFNMNTMQFVLACAGT